MDVSGADVVNIERCEIVDETINEKIEILRRDKLSEERGEGGYTIWSGVCGVRTEKKETIARVVKEKDFLVPQEGFFQANLYLTDRLVDEVCRAAAVEKIDTLVDAYCGSGLFSVLLSPFARNVIGIEQDDKAIECA
jgi:tRNA/tmRNA/rRNA uracil-C5-methylase (TrmA/RlmC/RlmD family)